MSASIASIPRVPPLRIVRSCPEHRCRIVRDQRLWSRYRSGEFRLHTENKERNPPFVDYKKQECVRNQEHFLLDDSYPPKHERHIVLRGHCFRLRNGKIGASGRIEPKEITIGEINYRQLEYKNPRCQLCEGGDMIPVEERFFSSTYKPDTPPQSEFRRLLGRVRRRWETMRDIFNQRGI